MVSLYETASFRAEAMPSVTGYCVRFPISDLDDLLLATQVGGAPRHVAARLAASGPLT